MDDSRDALRSLGWFFCSLHFNNLVPVVIPSNLRVHIRHRKAARKQGKLITVIQFLNRAFLGGGFFLGGLIMAFAYTATQDQRGIQSGFIVFTVPAQSIPLCMLALSLLLDPSAIPLQLTGLLSAHLHDFLSRLWPEFGGGWNIMTPPRFVSWLIKTPRMVQRQYGTAVHQARPSERPSHLSTAGGSTGASTGSVLPDSWKTRGSGQRLGGN